MPQSKHLGSYPSEFFDLYEQAIETPMGITFDTYAEANATRMALYGFRRALLKNPDTDPELALHIPAVRMTIDPAEDGSGKVTLKLNNKNPISDHLRRAVPLVEAS